MAATTPASLALVPRPVLRPWGGRRVAARFGWPADGPCGEWWLASSYPGCETALSSGGDLATWLDGPGRAAGCPAAADFPLLVKFLDAAEVLSVQVHPDDAVARRHGLPHGKTEAWHVLDVEPGACVWLGTVDGVGTDDLLARVAAGASDDEVRSLLRRAELSPGDTLVVPAGTVHAVGAGVTLYEVQQNSDATYRIHDWGRGRELHLDRARDALVDRSPPPLHRAPPAIDAWTTLAETPAFVLRRARVGGGLVVEPRGTFAILTALDGRGRLGPAGEPLAAGDTHLVLGPLEVTGAGLDLLVAEAPRA